jgi:alkylhydroperoxidase family enzyme
MLARFIESRIVASERTLGVNQDWLRHLYRASPAAFRKFMRVLPLAGHRKAASKEAFAVAHLVGSLSEDCGSCVQIAVNLARGEGVDAAILRAVLDDRPQDLRPELVAVMAYAKAVAHRGDDVVEQMEALRQMVGETAVCELALAVATARIFPVVKRGMGHAVSCSMVTLDLPDEREGQREGEREGGRTGAAMAHG